jgi:hypothetical protein
MQKHQDMKRPLEIGKKKISDKNYQISSQNVFEELNRGRK